MLIRVRGRDQLAGSNQHDGAAEVWTGTVLLPVVSHTAPRTVSGDAEGYRFIVVTHKYVSHSVITSSAPGGIMRWLLTLL